jgi:cellulose synthase (UDP-forming)
MSPKRLLALWRERWAKPDVAAVLQVPYIDGKVSQWGIKFAQEMRWSLVGILVFFVFLLAWFSVVLLPVSLSLNSQIAFSAFLLLSALFLRIHAGVLPTLILMGMSFVVSARYLYWRINATLEPDFDAAFGFGFALLLIELYFSLQALLGFIAGRWPIKRAQSNLRNDSNLWPSVDVFIICDEQPLSSIESAIKNVVSFDWPHRKIKTYLLDGVLREEIKNLADGSNSNYITRTDDFKGLLNGINAALLDSKSDFVVIIECDKVPGKEVLKSTIGWFLRDAKLGLLLSPKHFLSPEPSKLTYDLFHNCDLEGSFAMMRRSMLLRLGDEQSQLVTTPLRMDKDMRSLGYEIAYVGLPKSQVARHEKESVDVSQLSNSSALYFRVNQPVINSPLLAWRLRLASLQVALDFYQPVARFLFMAAPLPYLLGGVNIIQADIPLIAAYAIPHFIHWYIAKARQENTKRLTIWVDFKESLLAIYLTVLTSISFIKTELQQLKNNAELETGKNKPSFDWLILTPWMLITLLNLIGILIGLVNFPFDEQQDWPIACFYILWAAGNFLILSSIAAVAEEIKHIRHYSHLQMFRPVMLQLPLGRSLACVTENFPANILTMRVPTTTTLVAGSLVNFSLFKGNRELGLPGVVDSLSDGKLNIRIPESAQSDYVAFAELVYSRGKNWPKWLPGRDADSPLPRWLYKLLDAFQTAYKSWRKNYKKNSSLIQLSFFWKNKK